MPERSSDVHLPVGGLDADPGLRPAYHEFVSEKAPWCERDDELPCFAQAKNEKESFALSTKEAVSLRATEDHATGSCLCGSIAYEASGPFEVMRACHCSRCRRRSGSAYFTGVPCQASGLKVLRGQDGVKQFTLPGTRYYTYSFCSVCGVSVPMQLPGIDRAFISTGTLDNDPGAELRYHIFYASKAPWFEARDGLPRFDAFPPRDFKM